jgi:hypothetical protein
MKAIAGGTWAESITRLLPSCDSVLSQPSPKIPKAKVK